MELEITQIPPLQPGEASMLDMHSLLNVVSVLHGELTLLGLHLADDPDLFRAGLAHCIRVRDSFFDPAQALAAAAAAPGHEAEILAEIDTQLRQRPALAAAPDVQESLTNIRSVFHILDVRVREILARAGQPDRWLEIAVADLRADFREVFAAIEKNSKGRFRIIYNLALQQPTDYYVDFVIECATGQTIAMPLVFKDVMRDLIANARKYTPRGGTINVGLHETATELRFVVQDSGCGIPPDELEAVVHYGHRGSNVQAVRTMGGGFGLTKAFLVTKQFGGRFWLKSELGGGTRITLSLPRPTAA